MATGKLAEVEEDATYITEKRFADQREEYQRELTKREQAEAREAAKSIDSTTAETQVSSNTGSTPTELNAPKSGKGK